MDVLPRVSHDARGGWRVEYSGFHSAQVRDSPSARLSKP